MHSDCSTPGVRTLEEEDEQDDQENKRQQEKIRHQPLLPVIDTKKRGVRYAALQRSPDLPEV